MATSRSFGRIVSLGMVLGLLVCPPLTAHADTSGTTFFAISVGDLDAAIEWYTEMLELESTRLPGSASVQVALLQGRGLVVELIRHASGAALEARLPEVQNRYLVHGLFKVGFFVEDLDMTIERLTSRGATFQGDVFTDPVLRVRSILLLDNSRNVIQLFQRIAEP